MMKYSTEGKEDDIGNEVTLRDYRCGDQSLDLVHHPHCFHLVE